MFVFGSGVLIGTPSGSNPTPVNFGLIQEATYEESGTLKSLFGQNRRAIAVGAGTIKATLKAKAARISGLAFASLFYGISPSSGQIASIIGESGTVPGSSTYTITVANGSTFSADLGVVYAATGLPLSRGATATGTGVYSVNTTTGVYTFHSSDASASVLISYSYTVSATGQKFTINNPVLGNTVTFAATLYGVDPTNTSNTISLQLYKVVMAKLSFGTKLEDFTLPDFEGECYCNSAGNLGQWNFPDTM